MRNAFRFRHKGAYSEYAIKKMLVFQKFSNNMREGKTSVASTIGKKTVRIIRKKISISEQYPYEKGFVIEKAFSHSFPFSNSPKGKNGSRQETVFETFRR